MTDEEKRLDKFSKTYLTKLRKEKLSEEFHQNFLRLAEEELKKQTTATPRLQTSRIREFLVLSFAVGLVGFGAVGVMQKDKPHVTVKQGFVDVKKDEILTGPSAWAILELKNRYRIKIQPNSHIEMKRLKPSFLPGHTVFHLSRGEVLIKIGDEPGEKYPLEIETTQTFAKAMGTQFAVTAPSFKVPQSLVRVLGGTVQVGQILKTGSRSPSMVSVSSGYEVLVSFEEKVLKPRQMVSQERKALKEMFQFGHKNQIILLIDMRPSRVDQLLEPCQVYMRVDVGNKEFENIKSILFRIRRAFKTRSPHEHRQAVQEFEEAIERQDELNRASGLLLIGAYHTYLDQPGEAVRVFEKVIREYPDSSYRSLAMMAAAKIHEERLANPERSAYWRSRILEEYPASPEAENLEK